MVRWIPSIISFSLITGFSSVSYVFSAVWELSCAPPSVFLSLTRQSVFRNETWDILSVIFDTSRCPPLIWPIVIIFVVS